MEGRALELAARVAADPELARVAVGNFRKEVVTGAVSWEVATQFERPAQMWSMRRSAALSVPVISHSTSVVRPSRET